MNIESMEQIIQEAALDEIIISMDAAGNISLSGKDNVVSAFMVRHSHHKNELTAYLRSQRAYAVQEPDQSTKVKPGIRKAALAFFRDNKDPLQAKGWTAPEIYRRNMRCQGIAWLPIWEQVADGKVRVAIQESGAIAFSWINASGSTITQRAYHEPTPAKKVIRGNIV